MKLIDSINTYIGSVKWLATMNRFMNDPDRGPSHGVTQGLFAGLLLLAATFLPIYIVITLCVLNHCRILYQELIIEGWAKKPKEPDFYFDTFFRPAQSDALVALAYLPPFWWFLWCPFILLLGYKTHSDKPFLIQWIFK